jgi:hypothetical protein
VRDVLERHFLDVNTREVLMRRCVCVCVCVCVCIARAATAAFEKAKDIDREHHVSSKGQGVAEGGNLRLCSLVIRSG